MVAEQAKLIERLRARIAELEARLGKDSHNSSKPPPRSQRKRSGRKPGGQEGHKGSTRTLVDEPDHLVVVALEGTCSCGRCRSQIESQPLPERRQVVALIVRREVTEYRVVGGTCVCGRDHRSDFPQEVRAPVQYGPGVSAFAVYMTQYQFVPFERTAAVLDELAGIAISAGSLVRMVQTAAAGVQAPVAAIREALVAAPMAHADETGMRVGGALQWLHVLSTASLTAYFPHVKRGGEAIEAFGLLPRFAGVLVHDHWKPYAALACEHAYCNAHHLCELIAIAETIPSQRPWVENMIGLLCEANTVTIEARDVGLEALPEATARAIQARYDAIIDVAKARNPPRQPPPGRRRRVRQSPAHNLVNRLSDNREAVLRFVTDLRVPFDNNQAERDIRMPKLKQKVSGCFRSKQGATHFADIRSYLSTLRKQSANIFQSLILIFQGSPPMPRLTPE